MPSGKKRIHDIRTIEDFEKTFFPTAYKEKQQKKEIDPKAIGISMARKSLKKILCRAG